MVEVLALQPELVRLFYIFIYKFVYSYKMKNEFKLNFKKHIKSYAKYSNYTIKKKTFLFMIMKRHALKRAHML